MKENETILQYRACAEDPGPFKVEAVNSFYDQKDPERRSTGAGSASPREHGRPRFIRLL